MLKFQEALMVDYRQTPTLTITNGTSVSQSIDLDVRGLVGFIAPAAWTAAALNIEVSADRSTWATGGLLDGSGAPVSSWSAVTPLAAYAVDPVSMLPWRYVRFRSGTSASPVNQAADRVFTLVLRALE
jgi:hypothetical protein